MTLPQADWVGSPDLTRAGARRAALAAARVRADQGMDAAARRAERLHAGWCGMALHHLRQFAKHQGDRQLWTVEMARSVIEQDLPKPSDGRAWGVVVVRALAAGYIVKTDKTAAAASSNGSPKPLFRKGPSA